MRAPGEPRGFIVVAGAGTDPDLIGRRLHAAGLGAVAAAPFFAGLEERGALCVGGRDEQRKLESREMELLCELGMLTGEALGHHEHRELTAGDSQAEIRALVKALAEADGDTYRHSLEVAATATVVGERLGLGRAEIVEVELAALLHDVGKLRLPPHILGKPGQLTEDERCLVRLHPEWGVCDAYGAMTKRRPYSEPLNVDSALLELERHAGTQFDPDAVEALCSVVRCAQAVPA